MALIAFERAPIIEETVTAAGLCRLRDLFFVQLTQKNGTFIHGVDSTAMQEGGDRLPFAAIIEIATELYHIRGLRLTDGHLHKMKYERHERRVV